MRFNQSVVVNNILTVLSDAARQNKLGGFKVNPDSIKQVFLPTDGSESTVKGEFYKEIVNYIEVHEATRCIIRHGFMLLWFKDWMNEVTSNSFDEKELATSFAVIPYNQGVTGPIKRIINSHNVEVGQKHFQTLWHIFAKPKDPVTNEQLTDAFYSIPWNDCDHEYIGQTKRQFGTRLKEHQKAVFFYK